MTDILTNSHITHVELLESYLRGFEEDVAVSGFATPRYRCMSSLSCHGKQSNFVRGWYFRI